MKKTLVLLVLFFFIFSFQKVDAQTCGGSGQCCETVSRRFCDGDVNGTPCTTNSQCLLGQTCQTVWGCLLYSTGCTYSASLGRCYVQCCPGCSVTQDSCYVQNACPSGQILCTDCGCMPDSRTCNEWRSLGCQEPTPTPTPNPPTPPPCTPTCNAPLCGQNNGCGGTCSNADDGAPATPGSLVPTSGATVVMNPTTGQVTFDWATVAKAENYQYEIYPEGGSCASSGSFCGTTTASQYTFVPSAASYTARVRAVNTSCGTDYSAWSAYTTFATHGAVSGSVYLDPNITASLTGGICTTGASLTAVNPSTTVSISQNGVDYADASVGGSGTYQVSAPYWNPGNNVIQLNISGNYTCSCPAGCVYSGIDTPQTPVNFYIVEARDPWYQAEGGSIMALQTSGAAIRSYISDVCSSDPDCSPYLIRQANGVANTSGSVVTGGGSVDVSNAAGEQVNAIDEDGRNVVATIDRKSALERYDYFIRLYKFPETPVSDFGTTASDAQKPVAQPVNTGVNAFYHNGDLRIEDQWDVANGESITVFVNGNVDVAAPIQTEVGGFIAIIASGDIAFDPAVENTVVSDESGVVEGVFIANGQIVVESRGAAAGGDGKFVGEGTFVGWNGIVLNRDFDDTAGARVLNNTNPTELFRYRPDFLLYAPEEIRVPRYVWREIAP